MARRKKAKPRSTREGSGESRQVDAGCEPRDSETAKRHPQRIPWITCLLYAIAALILVFVFGPWLQRTIQGQFFGLSGDYGTDFFRYSQGSAGLFELGVDPYSNAQMFRAFEEGRLGTDHPNPFYDEQMANQGFAETPDPIAKGVVSPPFLLVLIYPLVALCGYTLALNVWVVASFLGIAWMSSIVWQQLIPPAPRWTQIGSHAAMLSLLVFSSFPVLWSAIYGQFEVIYFVALGGAVYLWSFERNRPSTPLWIGSLLALGGAVKIFPVLMFAYFFWRVFRKCSNPASVKTLFAHPESKILLFGLMFFAVFNLLTGVAGGFGIFHSFVDKVADLQVEGTGPSMKGNLLAYLNYVPVWMFGPFTRMTGNMWYLYALIAAAVVVAIAKSIRSDVGTNGLMPEDRWSRLLEMTLILAALPTVLPHWWIYYNVVLILPLMACFMAARKSTEPRTRCWILALTTLSFVLTFSYLTTSFFFGAFPGVYEILINRAGVNAALERASAEPALLENLVYSKAFGRPHVLEFEGRVVSPFNLLYGYPGTVFLMAANWIALRSHHREMSGEADAEAELTAVAADDRSARTSRRNVLLSLAGGALLSLTGGYAMVLEGRRRLGRLSHVDFVTGEHGVDAPEPYVEQLLKRLEQTAPENHRGESGGLALDLLPPQHFIEAVAQSDEALAKALLQQDRGYFENPAIAEKLLALFGQYQADLNRQYPSWFKAGEQPDIPAWRYAGYPGGLLAALERVCREQSIPLRRLDQDWMQWQLRFLYEYTWQKSLEALSQSDFAEFGKFIFEHQRALSRHQVMVEGRVKQLRASLPHAPTEANAWRAGFVYVQEPAFTALASYPACRDLGDDATLEMGVRVGTVYVVEELLRRARLAKHRNPREALSFAQAVISQIGSDQVVAWWSPQKAVGPKDILRSLSQDGLFDIGQIELEGLLMWNKPLSQAS